MWEQEKLKFKRKSATDLAPKTARGTENRLRSNPGPAKKNALGAN